MGNKKDGGTFDEVAAGVVGVVTATAAAAVPLMGVTTPAALLTVAGAAAAQPFLTALYRRSTQGQLASFATYLAKRIKGTEDISDEEIAAIIEDWIEGKENRRQVVVSTVRRMLDDVDTAALRPLVNLVFRYRDQAPDYVFRATARVLADLSATELNDLRKLATWALDKSKLDDLTITTSELEQQGSEWHKTGVWCTLLLRDEFVGKSEPNSKAERYHELLGLSDPLRLFQVLRVNALGFDGGGVAFDSGPGKIVFQRAILEHLAAVLGPA